MKTPTLDAVLASPSVHNLTKDILRMALDKDIVGAYYDVQLAADVLKARMDWIPPRLRQEVTEPEAASREAHRANPT